MTRRHFDVVVEQMQAAVKLPFEAIIAMDERMARFMATNMKDHARLEDVGQSHDRRLQSIERTR